LYLDFEKFFSGYTSRIARFAKTNWTQLQFIFEIKDQDIHTSYRAYASDSVIEIFSKANFKALNGSQQEVDELLNRRLFDMIPMETKVNTYQLPRQSVIARDQSGNVTLPCGVLPPAEFAEEKIDPDTKKK